MKIMRLATLRIVSLAFLMPGLAGLVVSAVISTNYLDTLPRTPIPSELRMTPRNIHGIEVYQTPEENQQLNLIEFSSVGIFLVGLTLGVVYLEKWAAARARAGEEGELSAVNYH